MARKFKAGDMIQLYFEWEYNVGNERRSGWLDAVAAGLETQGMTNITALNDVDFDGWTEVQGAWETSNVRPHPDPDRAWADFCKWRLTNASD